MRNEEREGEGAGRPGERTFIVKLMCAGVGCQSHAMHITRLDIVGNGVTIGWVRGIYPDGVILSPNRQPEIMYVPGTGCLVAGSVSEHRRPRKLPMGEERAAQWRAVGRRNSVERLGRQRVGRVSGLEWRGRVVCGLRVCGLLMVGRASDKAWGSQIMRGN